jgi:hypothetical protein
VARAFIEIVTLDLHTGEEVFLLPEHTANAVVLHLKHALGVLG